MQELGLKVYYSQAKYEYLGRVIRGLLSLAVVPMDRVFEGYGLVTEYAAKVDEEIQTRVQALTQYYYNTWLRGHFSIESWNFFASYMQRTNNVSEGFNHNLNSQPEFVGINGDPNLWLLIKVMLNILTRTKQRAEQFRLGQDPRWRRGAVTAATRKQEARHALMLKLSQNKILLPEYMDTVGKTSLLMLQQRPYLQSKNPHVETDANTSKAKETSETPASSNHAKSSGKKTSESKVSSQTPDPSSNSKSSGKKVSGKKNSANKVPSKTPDATSNSQSSDKKTSEKKVNYKTPEASSTSKSTGSKDKISIIGSSGKKVTSSPGQKTPRLPHLTAETPTRTPGKGTITKFRFIIMISFIFSTLAFVHRLFREESH